ncbi:MAG: hypothetical protein HRU15_09600 [Planctomycetes bacterium]|nr:hypothetical protein [Planctomycetota bacterium]
MGIISTIKAGWTTTQMVRGMKKLRAADNDEQRQRAREYLADVLGKQRGLATKIGQWIAESGNEEDPMHSLCDNMEQIDTVTICNAIEEALGMDIDDAFASFSDKAHAASLSQVHRAELHDGSDVAVKVQYPFIQDHLKGEMKILGLRPGIGPVKKWGVDIDGYRTIITENLKHELDYAGEIQRQESYRAALLADEQIMVARIFKDFSSETVICQEYLDGSTLEQAAEWDAKDRNALAVVLLRHFLRQVFHRGRIHADPHDGNYRFRLDNGIAKVVLYDFGSLCDVDSNCSIALLHLIQGLDVHNNVDPMACLVMAGFDAGKLQHIRAQIPAVCEELFKPFLKHDRFPIKEWNASQGIRDVLGEHAWWFRSAGPPTFLMLMRAFAGLMRQLHTLSAYIDWREILEDVCKEQWMQGMILQVPEVPGPTYPCSSIAQNLHVSVMRDGKQTVGLSLPALAVNTLETMVEPDVAERIAKRGYIIPDIVQACREGGYQKQTLFEDEFEGKEIKLWLD